MNFLEALRSGKRIRRRGWDEYVDSKPDVTFSPETNPHTVTVESLLSNDWEVEEESVAVTRTGFLSAVAEVLSEHGMRYLEAREYRSVQPGDLLDDSRLNKLLEKLGL